jgi:hypothetical protein
MNISIIFNARQGVYNWSIFRNGKIPHWQRGKVELNETVSEIESKFPDRKIVFSVS